MSFTYSGDPSASSLDAVRFMLSDVNSSRFLFDDAEIKWAITQEANIYMAAASLCNILITANGMVKMKKVGDLQIMFDPRFYVLLASKLTARGAAHQVPYVGGISIADKMAQQLDPDWVAPSASTTEFNNPQAEQPGPGPMTSPFGFPSH